MKPPKFRRSKATAKRICELIVEGYTLRQIAKLVGAKSHGTILWWAHDDQEFADQYARAKELQADSMAEDVSDIADNGTNDWYEREFGEGNVQLLTDHEHINRSRLRVDTRKWLMSKMLPKKYGDKLTLDGTLKHAPADALTDDELERVASGGGARTAETPALPPRPPRMVH